MDDEEPAWFPCWRCGHQYPRELEKCPSCGTKRKRRENNLLERIITRLHAD